MRRRERYGQPGNQDALAVVGRTLKTGDLAVTGRPGASFVFMKTGGPLTYSITDAGGPPKRNHPCDWLSNPQLLPETRHCRERHLDHRICPFYVWLRWEYRRHDG